MKISSVGRWRRPQRWPALRHRSSDAGGGVGGSFPLRGEQSADALQMRQGLGQTPVKGPSQGALARASLVQRPVH